ncbi:MAG TPA: ABC transporter substrate-binding protein [Actinophytocola sp.]|uniref:ABC transporter substrate-binding protein n=1 Tax=Actinophytocola sp. TaxID=1872138 RepID=UPI002DDD53C6|nr:ABC transporter substrate-binding protein [Actinophytocola sp.]HEV2778703.1 ABC transporter substrate-binding protein [Actinophytocola sp.]
MNRRLLALLTALLLALTACSKATSGDQNAGGVKTGPGVTDSTIKLGSLVDLTAVFAPLGKSLVQGTQLFWKQENDKGGVCGRTVEVTVKDHGYDPQKAVALYREVSGDVLGLQTVLGSPVITALRSSIAQDNLFVGFAGWTGAMLGDPHIQILGTTYDIEMITGLDFLMRSKGIKAGDKIGHIYFEGDYGENALRGSKYLAGQNGLTIVEQKIKASDTDLSAQVAALRNAGVAAILMSAGPAQTASAAGVARSVGLAVPIVANGPGFTPQLLSTPAGAALKENLHVVSSMAPPSLDSPGARTLADLFTKAHPNEQPTQVGSVFGYAQAQATRAVLQKACDNKDLTRQGLVTALHQISGLDTGGLVAGPLDYTNPDQPPTRTVYIAQADSSVPGGLKAVGGPVEAEAAKSYQPKA